jgi:hypothetical protein
MPTSIGELFKTNIPDLTQIADIQEAFRIYHYGVPVGVNASGITYNPNNTDPQNLEEFSVAGHLQTLTDRLDNFSSGLTESSFVGKGTLITAEAASSPIALEVGQSGQALFVNPFTLTGLEWRDIDVSIDNPATLSNKTLDFPSILRSGIKFLGTSPNEFLTTLVSIEPTANRTISLPNLTTTLIGTDTTDTLINKTISLTTNTITGTVAEFNTALTNADFLTTLTAVTVAQGGTGGTTALTAKTNLDIFRNSTNVAFGGKVYVSDPAVVGTTGAGITGAVAGDLWFW